MTSSNLIHLNGMIAIPGGLISSGEASAPGEAVRHFGEYFEIDRIAGTDQPETSKSFLASVSV